MKTFKWIYRYSYLGVLLAMALCWCGYCLYTISDIKNALHSVEYVDMTLGTFTDALEIFERSIYYKELLNKGLIASGIIFGVIVLLVVFQVVSPKVSKRHELAKIKRQERRDELKRMREEQAKNAPRPAYPTMQPPLEGNRPAVIPPQTPPLAQPQAPAHMQPQHVAPMPMAAPVQPPMGVSPGPVPMQPPVAPTVPTSEPINVAPMMPPMPTNAPQAVSQGSAAAGTFCPFCGIRLATDSVFCAACGNKIA